MAAAALPMMFERGGRAQAGWRNAMTPRTAAKPANLADSMNEPKRVPVLSSSAEPQEWVRERHSAEAGLPQNAMNGYDARGPQGPRQDGARPGEVPQAPEAPRAPQAPVSAETAALLREQAALNELALRCGRGDGAAWNELARMQHRKVYGICYRFTGSATEAEDCTQEVFLKMYRVIGTFDPARGAFGTWLTTLTRNLLVDQYRRGRNDRVTDSLDEPLGGDEEAGSPTKADRLQGGGRSQEQHVAGLELRAQIQMALKQVSPELREAVILRDLEDMDYKDIAEVLGVPQGTVKSRISRGRAELARLLKRIEGQVM
jgi:RNA polymerase sigma-70 factor, ECF subfamily